MKPFISAKEFKNKITIDRTSNCCGAPVEYDSDICSDPKCGEHCTVEVTCELCDGKGRVEEIDENRLYGKEVIDVPYKDVICPKCQGEGYINED